MEGKWKVLIGIIIAVCAMGLDTAARMFSIETHSVGYIIGLIAFIGGIVWGTRRS